MVNIRKMEERDIPYCAEIEMQSFGKRNVDNFEKCLNNANYAYYVVEKDEIVKGYCGLLFSLPDVELVTIAIDNECRHIGLGSMLLKDVLTKSITFGAKQMFLEVNTNNNIAKLLYDKFRFIPISVRKKYYDGKDDAVIMKKIL